MSSSIFDFGYMDLLRQASAGRGRLFLGKVAARESGRPVLLFVHGGYHGAWCFAHYLQHFDDLGIPAAAIDLRGHGGLPQDPDLVEHGVWQMAEDVVACCRALPGPPIPIGHSAGALVSAAAGELTSFYGFGLLAPSPPGQLECLAPLTLVPTGSLIEPPCLEVCRHKFLAGEVADDITAFRRRLCPESPQLLNDRRSLAIHIDRARFDIPAICISAGRDRGELHPEGQDLAVASFFGAEYHCLADAPHCLMISAVWRTSADLIGAWYRRIAER